MVKLIHTTVEDEIVKAVEELNNQLGIGANINASCCPGNVGLTSQVLLTIMFRLEESLGITIPTNAYIFHDKDSNKQLSIKEAALKLIKVAKDGN